MSTDFTPDTLVPPAPKHPRQRKIFWWGFFLLIIGLGTLWWSLHTLAEPPANFPLDVPLVIEEGWGVATIAAELKAQNVIRSQTLFYLTFLAQYEAHTLKASTYIFSRPLTVQEVADRLAEGDFASNLVRITHREGDSVAKLAPRIEEMLPGFDTARFILLAQQHEGRLFPDTYFVPEDFTVEQFIDVLQKRYAEATAPLQEEIAAHPLTEEEILTLASLLEREANSPETMRMVAGILQNRLEINMPLQVDASIEYELDKPLGALTPEDLERPSPYNTYLNFGLPPTPIGNPGLEAISAVLNPTPSEFYFYITGNDGQFYYATTFDEHRANIARYLR